MGSMGRKYSILPGNLELTVRDKSTALQALPDHLFQFSVDLMDFLEEILRFHEAIIAAVELEGVGVCTPAAQCKMNPLLLCLQDAAAIYDLIVHILFKLHELLGSDAMAGHRERFAYLHDKLAAFFQKASRIQYFKALVQIPSLTQSPPDFCVGSELDRHKSFRIAVIESHSSEDESEPHPPESSFGGVTAVPSRSSPSPTRNSSATSAATTDNQLLPLSDEPPDFSTLDLISGPPLMTHDGTVTQPAVEEHQTEVLHNKRHFGRLGCAQHDEDHEFLLETELLKSEVHHLKDEHERFVSSLVERIKTLESEIQDVVQQKSLLEEHCEELETKARLNANRAEAFEEKFVKLKHVYAKLRDEHVTLLRDSLEAQLMGVKSTDLKVSENGHGNGDVVLHSNGLLDRMVSPKPLIDSFGAHMQQTHSVVQNAVVHLNGTSVLQKYQNRLLSLTCARIVDGFDCLRNRLSSPERAQQCEFPTDYYVSILETASGEIQKFRDLLEETSDTDSDEFLLSVCDLASRLYAILSQHKAYSSQFDDDCQLLIKQFASDAVQLFQALATDQNAGSPNTPDVTRCLKQLDSSLERLRTVHSVLKQTDDEIEWLSLVDKEMCETAKSMTSAEERFRQLATTSFSTLPGTPLRVHQLILDRCSALIAAIRDLVLKSKMAQQSINEDTVNSQNYKRHGRWTQGILSAAKSVGACANVLVEVSDQLVSNREHVFERLLVVAQEVSASTTQLFVASRVKLPPDSLHLSELQTAVRLVSQTTGDLVGSVKSAIETHEAIELDFSGLTLTQAKRMQVESQVRVLKLEKALEDERYQLSQLRKHNYRDEAEVEERANCRVIEKLSDPDVKQAYQNHLL
ncbi:huntingtin interacting protein 1 [Clonorchis sinensis]|uniref:Huntingtin interacting protein 1 n=1 Tax=Clonorchis sinensis TaxID=79923 RepID=H2KRL8_CLOSI|nr:huntingtin interacting protein 1 [Clonorchis sinensis]